MIRRQSKTIKQSIKDIRHHPRTIGRIVLGCFSISMISLFIYTNLEDMWVRVSILPWLILIGGLLLSIEFTKTKATWFHWWAFFDDFGKQSIRRSVSVMNRTGIFPVVLTLYLLYLLLDQTQFMNLHLQPVFLALDETLLMILTLISWVGLVAYEDAEKEYQYKQNTWSQTYQMLWLSTVLSIMTGLILIEQVSELWWIGLIIANIAMLLVFLVGVMLMEEEE